MGIGPWNTEEENFDDQFDGCKTEAKHPTLDQLCQIEAIKGFTAKQREVWDYLTLDNLTQAEVGAKLNISQQAVADHMDACGAKIRKWAKQNKAMYIRLQQEIASNEPVERPNGYDAMQGMTNKIPVRRTERDGEWHGDK